MTRWRPDSHTTGAPNIAEHTVLVDEIERYAARIHASETGDDVPTTW